MPSIMMMPIIDVVERLYCQEKNQDHAGESPSDENMMTKDQSAI